MNISTAGDATFDAFLRRLTSESTQRIQVGSGRLEIERYRGQPDDGPKSAAAQHILAMCHQHPARFEGGEGPNANASYTKQPGALSLVPAGVVPVLHARTQFDLIVCALDPTLVNDVGSEMERSPYGELRLLANIPDSATQQLMTLLLAEAKEGFGERLYTDHLAHALAFRLLFLGKMPRPKTSTKAMPALPRHILRRVIDRMRDLTSDLGLQALAAESGYSRVHFARMFRAATGQTPHRYLLHLRVERAQELMRNPSLSLTDIALDCGFSSHSHLTRPFHELLGVTPSEYRRSSGARAKPGRSMTLLF
jgi:AraC family transcriptional regulator